MADTVDALERGRESYSSRAWLAAYEALSAADRAAPLGAQDLELLATSAYMLGHEEEHHRVLERGHQAHLDAADVMRAARCASWLAVHLQLVGEIGQATGWFGRARRLVEREGRECVEQGYVLMPVVFQQAASGDLDAAIATAAEAAEIGERFGDPDLSALSRMDQGGFLVAQGRVVEGLRLLDEAMVAVTTGELSPIPSGLVYCGVILGCQAAYEPRRAQEWTAALAKWCARQPDMVAFTGRCLVHRAEIMELRGAWGDALDEARQASERAFRSKSERAAAEAIYRQAEIHRLRGDFARAEDAYLEAGRRGWEPQPGLALLRLAQGRSDAAAAAIRRALAETSDTPKRARLLSAGVEIMLAVGETDEARDACDELDEVAKGYGGSLLGAMSAHARGAVDLAGGDAPAALVALRRAWRLWYELEAPYEAARARVLVGLACRALGDDDAAAMELEAARHAFAELGAAPELARVDSLARTTATGDTHGLTPRELGVLRLLAAGETNKTIAAELILSERTVHRHVSNIFAKLRVSSRAAATAYAYRHKLL
jgi:DNA-binding CsgD family transcriptional regulator/tetratricopeptide (TPR) repeat protein